MKHTFKVPVIHHVSFGVDVEVQADNEEQAKKLALNPSVELPDGYDWDRMAFERAELGNWAKVENLSA